MVIIITKSNLAEFTNFGMVKFVTICNTNIVKMTPGKMVEINNDSRLFSLMAIYFLKYLQTVQATSASIFNSNSETNCISFTLSLHEKFKKLYLTCINLKPA